MRKLAHDEIIRLDPADLDSEARHPVCLVLENVRSAHNVGAVLRSADGAFIERVILAGITPGADHKGVHKAALGAQDMVPWMQCEDLCSELQEMRRAGYTLVALELTDSPSTHEDLHAEHFPLCLIAGNEVTGVTEAVLELCDFALEIPQFGAKQSLNISVAASIALFDIVRRYRSFKTS